MDLEALGRAYPNFVASFESTKLDLEVLVGKFRKSGSYSQEADMLLALEIKLAQEKKILKAYHNEYVDHETLPKQVGVKKPQRLDCNKW